MRSGCQDAGCSSSVHERSVRSQCFRLKTLIPTDKLHIYKYICIYKHISVVQVHANTQLCCEVFSAGRTTVACRIYFYNFDYAYVAARGILLPAVASFMYRKPVAIIMWKYLSGLDCNVFPKEVSMYCGTIDGRRWYRLPGVL